MAWLQSTINWLPDLSLASRGGGNSRSLVMRTMAAPKHNDEYRHLPRVFDQRWPSIIIQPKS